MTLRLSVIVRIPTVFWNLNMYLKCSGILKMYLNVLELNLEVYLNLYWNFISAITAVVLEFHSYETVGTMISYN